MKLFKKLTILLLLAIIFSCNDDDFATGPTGLPTGNNHDATAFAENFGNEINRTFLGKVIDVNEHPIEGVNITIGNQTALTDANGVFIINDATVHERFAYIKAEKSGYIHGSRSVVPSTGTNKVTIMLLEETIVGTTSSGTSETISLSNGASVSLQGDYVDGSGTAYSGDVDVIIHHLDPTDDNMTNQMPGMLYAANSDDEERMLQTYGMLAVELRGSNGEDLNLAEGTTAEIKVPLDASLLANAPSTIPLWYFDEILGYWIEEGEATLVGNTYVGTVSHFSFWNCDIPAEAINLCVNVTDESSNPISNLHVTITSSVYGARSGYTNEKGKVCGLVPSNEELEINIYYYECGMNTIYTSTIGPFNTDSSIDVQVTSTSQLVIQNVVGMFNDCDGNAVTDGYVVLTYGNQQFTDIVTDGNFEINFVSCVDGNVFVIEVFDYANSQTTGEINYTFTEPFTNLGTLTSCNDVIGFIIYQVDSNPTIVYTNDVSTFYEGPGTALIAGLTNVNNNNGFNLEFYQCNGLGTYNTLNDPISFWFIDTNDNLGNQDPKDITFNVTAIKGETGDYTDINFSGTYNLGSVSHTIVGTIHAN